MSLRTYAAQSNDAKPGVSSGECVEFLKSSIALSFMAPGRLSAPGASFTAIRRKLEHRTRMVTARSSGASASMISECEELSRLMVVPGSQPMPDAAGFTRPSRCLVAAPTISRQIDVVIRELTLVPTMRVAPDDDPWSANTVERKGEISVADALSGACESARTVANSRLPERCVSPDNLG